MIYGRDAVVCVRAWANGGPVRRWNSSKLPGHRLRMDRASYEERLSGSQAPALYALSLLVVVSLSGGSL